MLGSNGVKSTASSSSSHVVAHRHTVEIKDFKFHPEKLSVRVGERVTFYHRDHPKSEHEILFLPGKDPCSGPLTHGQSWTTVFTEVGTMKFYDGYYVHMKGEVEVLDVSEAKTENKENGDETSDVLKPFFRDFASDDASSSASFVSSSDNSTSSYLHTYPDGRISPLHDEIFVVDVVGMMFSPDAIVIPVGTTVVWTVCL